MAFNTKLTNKYSRFYNGTARGSSRAKRRTIILSSKGIISALIIFFIIGFILSTQFWRIFYESPKPLYYKPTNQRWLQIRERIIQTDPKSLDYLSRLDCGQVLANNSEYIKKFVAKYGRISINDPPENSLPMDCKSIHERSGIYFQTNKEAFEYPIAYARIHYLFLELEFARGYSPSNWYCFVVDAKADALFKKRIGDLANCFPNAFSVEEISITHGGRNMTAAHLRCMELLERPDKRWEYIVLLQNYDVNIRTHGEAVQVFKWMDGANDVKIAQLPDDGRIDEKQDWSFQALQLFRNSTRNVIPSPISGYPPKLQFSAGYVESSFSRAAVRFMVKALNLKELIKRVQQKEFGVDEIVFSTLVASDAIQLPGAFTHSCLNKGKRVEALTRFSLWEPVHSFCRTNHFRSGICVYGLEDLPWLSTLPHLFANKMFPEFDFGAAFCWSEAMFNRSYLEPSEKSVKRMKDYQDFYVNRPQVRFQAYRREMLKKFSGMDAGKTNLTKAYEDSLNNFNCTMSITFDT